MYYVLSESTNKSDSSTTKFSATSIRRGFDLVKKSLTEYITTTSGYLSEMITAVKDTIARRDVKLLSTSADTISKKLEELTNFLKETAKQTGSTGYLEIQEDWLTAIQENLTKMKDTSLPLDKRVEALAVTKQALEKTYKQLLDWGDVIKNELDKYRDDLAGKLEAELAKVKSYITPLIVINIAIIFATAITLYLVAKKKRLPLKEVIKRYKAWLYIPLGSIGVSLLILGVRAIQYLVQKRSIKQETLRTLITYVEHTKFAFIPWEER